MENSSSHLTWSFDEIRKFLLKVDNLGYVSNYFKFMKTRIEDLTSFLDAIYEPSTLNFSMRCNTIRNGISCEKDIPDCDVCGENVRFLKKERIFSQYCSLKCSRVGAMRSMKESLTHAGKEHPLQREEVRRKIKSTVMSRYGVDNPMQLPHLAQRMRDTMLTRYGVEQPMHVPSIKKRQKKQLAKTYVTRGDEIIEKRKITNMDRIGVETALLLPTSREKMRVSLQSDEVKEKRKATNRLNREVDNAMQCKEHMDLLENAGFLKDLYNSHGGVKAARIIGVSDVTVYNYMKQHGIPIDETVGSSFAERELAEYVKSLVGEDNVITSDRTVLKGKELDIYIPSHNLAIEFNGLFWHSSKFKNPTDHLDKTRKCEDSGIHLIQVFEDEWYKTPEVIKRSIAVRLGLANLDRVYARKCAVVELNNSDVREFYTSNHVQGSMNASRVYGLEHDGVLVAAMSFKQNYDYMELTRYATSAHVIGGFSKLLKHFFKCNTGCERVVSFADRRWSMGEVYEKNGFDLTKTLRPNYFYVEGNRRVRKQNYRHKYLSEKLESYDPLKSEKENTEANGIYRIYDCGLLKFEITRDKLGL